MAPPSPPPPLPPDPSDLSLGSVSASILGSVPGSAPAAGSVSLEAPASSVLFSDSAAGFKAGLLNSPANSALSPMDMGSPPTTGQVSNNPVPGSPQDKNFSWAKNLHSAAHFPVTEVPLSTSAEGRPRVRVSNGIFERGAKLHSDYIVGIFYGKAPSYGKIWGVLNYLWGKNKRVTIHHLSKNAYLFYNSFAYLKESHPPT
ncbi:DUF4283 domain-containing protein [Raphanus sativus]|nr:DUF4283 domain-containing protein [Raphanus sativus]